MIAVFNQSHPKRNDASVTRGMLKIGLTSVELLVSMAVISVLIGMIVPAVNSAREAARKTNCLNNLRQIGVALHNAESTRQRFPGSAIATKESPINRSLHLNLLPYLSLANVFERFDKSENGMGARIDPPSSNLNNELLGLKLPIFVCGSDPSPIVRNSYRLCVGTSPGDHVLQAGRGDDSDKGFRWILGESNPVILDGRSQTIAFAEKLAGDGDPSAYTPWCDMRMIQPAPHYGNDSPGGAIKMCELPDDSEPDHVSYGGSTWLFSGFSQTWYNHVLPPNAIVTDCNNGAPESDGTYTARSLHRGGANVLLVDGSARFVSENISLDVWRALGTIEAGEAVPGEW